MLDIRPISYRARSHSESGRTLTHAHGRAWLGPAWAALAGMAWAMTWTWPMLNPFRLDIVLHEDWAQHTLGWLFFRNQPLFNYPLGRLDNFLHPMGTTLGYMDAIPGVALALRPFSAVLPRDFQYLGIWIVACVMSVAVVGAWLARRVTPHWEQQALVGLLMSMSPTLVHRIIHPALCGHALFIAAFGLHLRGALTRTELRRNVIAAIVLTLVAAFVHPYLVIMVLAFTVGVPLALHRGLRLRHLLASELVMIGGTVLVLTVLGYGRGGIKDEIGGFGYFSANLNTLINGMGFSRLFESLPMGWGQGEGFAYLGAGVFWLLALSAVGMLVPRFRREVLALPWRRTLWPSLVIAGFAVFAFATPVRWGEQELLHIEAYDRVSNIVQAFRSSGRYIWPLHYALSLLGAISVVYGLRHSRVAGTLALLLGIALQAHDIRTRETRLRFVHGRDRVLQAEEWGLAASDYKHLVLFPTEILDACGDFYHGRFVNELAYLAYRQRWTFNSGYAARVQRETAAYCDRLSRSVRAGEFDPHTLYVMRYARPARRFQKAGGTCGHLDGLRVCVKSGDTPLGRYLATHP